MNIIVTIGSGNAKKMNIITDLETMDRIWLETCNNVDEARKSGRSVEVFLFINCSAILGHINVFYETADVHSLRMNADRSY